MPRPRHLPTDLIVRGYVEGLSSRRLASLHKCTVPGILRVLRREGVYIRPQSVRVSQPITLYQELSNLLVFVVDQDLHNVGAYMSKGMSHRDATHVLREHQKAQPKSAIYIWKDEVHKSGLQRLIDHRNGSDPSERIHARKCQIVDVPLKGAKIFYDTWHLQGSPNYVQHTLALVFDGKPVSMMSFTNPTSCRGLHVPWMLQRFACVGRVPGAASRLLSAFRKHHAGDMVSYSDNRYSPDGHLYGLLGFTLQDEYRPDYRYWREGEWYAKNTKQRKHLISELRARGEGISDGDTEFSMAERLGYKRCYDAGKKSWLLRHPHLPLPLAVTA